MIAVKSVSIGRGQSVVLTLTQVTYPAAAACGNTSFAWQAKAWSESNFNDDQFKLDSNSKLTQTLSAACSMSFMNQPKDTFAGTNITNTPYNPASSSLVTVQLTVNMLPSPDTLVTVTSSCLASSVTATSTGGVATFSNLLSKGAPGATGCKLTASAAGYTTTMSTAFDVNVPTLMFVNQPSTTLGGALITNTPYNIPAGLFVSVKLLLDGNLTTSFDGTSVTIAGACVGSGGTANVAGGVATFNMLKSASVANPTICGLTASVPSLPPFPSVASSGFSVTPAAPGDLVCAGQPGTSTFTDATGTVSGNRGASNKDGSTCVAVVYSPTGLATGTDKVVNFKWDTASQPNAAFSYSVKWPKTAVDPITGLPPGRHTKVAWETDKYTVTGPDYVFGVACLSPDLPAPYGTLAADITDPNVTTILVNVTGTLPSGTFPIVIGTERMSVAGVAAGSPSTFTVVRGDGQTTKAAHSAVPTAYVMSTPLPIDHNPTMAPPNTAVPNPYLNKQAQMCIQFEGFMSLSPGFVQFMTTIFDIGDGWVSYD